MIRRILSVALVTAMLVCLGPKSAPVTGMVTGTHQTAMATSTRGSGRGEIVYKSGVTRITESAEDLLMDYLHRYYTSLVNLDTQTISDLFASDAQTNASSNRNSWDVEVGIRKMQQTNLALNSYAFQFTINTVLKRDDGDVTIRGTENATQRFAAYSGVDSESYNIGHSFTLTKEGGRWRLREHMQYSGANNVLNGRRYGSTTSSYAKVSKSAYLEQAQKHTAGRGTQGTDPGEVEYDIPYDRDAAVEYAREWVGTRNTDDWPSYDRSGGNCMNYVSQALLAGGIPMDTVSPGQWKWYGGTPSASFTASGRSSSWSGVNDFLTYVKTNQGYGMVAKANVPFYTGEVGDVIHLGTDSGSLRHTVLITDVITDKNGNVVDYLVCSNTADLKDYPVSAYHYTYQVLIKVYGWNNE